MTLAYLLFGVTCFLIGEYHGHLKARRIRRKLYSEHRTVLMCRICGARTNMVEATRMEHYVGCVLQRLGL